MIRATDLFDNVLLSADFLSHRKIHQGSLFERRKIRALAHQAKYEPEINCPDIQILDRSVTPDLFRNATQNYRNPVVVRGLMQDVDAVDRWDHNYLSDLCGEFRYRMVENGNTDDVIGGNVLFTEDTVRNLVSGLLVGEDARYLAGVSQIFVDNPQLIDDLHLERLHALLGEVGLRKRFDAMNMFIGGRGTRSRIHCAFAGNFFVNVVGRKRWRLLPPRYKYLLLPVPAHPFIYSMTYFDPLDTDPARAEFARALPFYEVVLEPGDLIYNGPWWWHQVENLEWLNVGCAIRLGQFFADYLNNATFTLLSIQPQVYALRLLFSVQRLLRRHNKDFRTYLLEFLHQQQVQRSKRFSGHKG